MKVKYTREAQKQARYERRRWRDYRDHREIFDEELAAWTRVLETAPKLAVYGLLAGKPVRRIQMQKTKVHLYYVIEEDLKLVRIVSVWGSRRGDGPQFDE